MKGISPILATVILIAITVGTALLLWAFVQQYISAHTSSIPEICLNTVDFKCRYENGNITFCMFQHLSGKKLNDVTINFICKNPQKSNDEEIGIVPVGSLKSISTNFSCSLQELSIFVIGRCEGFKNNQTIYRCDGVNCVFD
ncbi:MAG: archaellin/type IV pilin N-terminal domain-containing protein [Candidatus Aenigmatarchaeota archaeon]